MSRRTRERKLREQQENAIKKREARKHWKLRLGKRALMAIATFFLVCYVAFAGRMTWSWFATKWVRLTPVSEVGEVAKKHLLAMPPTPEELRIWLSNRPESEGEQVMKALEPWVPKMSGMTFLLYARWEDYAGKPEEALFWRQYARFRIRFDALRCGSYDAIGMMADILKFVPPAPPDELVLETPANLPKVLRRILQYDSEHPAENNPQEFCRALTSAQEFRDKMKVTMEPPSGWEGIRRTLRGITTYEIMHMEANLKEKDAEAPALSPDNKSVEEPPAASACPKSGRTKDGKPCKPGKPKAAGTPTP